MHQPPLTLIKSREDIEQAIGTLCSRLAKDGVVSNYTALVLLEGADQFFTALAQRLETGHGLRFGHVAKVKLNSYHDTCSTGNVEGIENIPFDELGGNIMIIDDILDTGCTLSNVIEAIHGSKCAKNGGKVLSCVLFNKETGSPRIEADYSAMSVPDYFVVGYGLDHNGSYRKLDGLYIKE